MYNPYTVSFCQAMDENDATQFLKEAQKEFSNLISKGGFELIPSIIVIDGDNICPEVWSIQQKQQVKTR